MLGFFFSYYFTAVFILSSYIAGRMAWLCVPSSTDIDLTLSTTPNWERCPALYLSCTVPCLNVSSLFFWSISYSMYPPDEAWRDHRSLCAFRTTLLETWTLLLKWLRSSWTSPRCLTLKVTLKIWKKKNQKKWQHNQLLQRSKKIVWLDLWLTAYPEDTFLKIYTWYSLWLEEGTVYVFDKLKAAAAPPKSHRSKLSKRTQKRRAKREKVDYKVCSQNHYWSSRRDLNCTGTGNDAKDRRRRSSVFLQSWWIHLAVSLLCKISSLCSSVYCVN